MVLSEAIGDYGEYARHKLGHTTSTYYSYVSWQRNFARWLAANGTCDPPVQEITAQVVRRYSYSLSGRNLRPRTIRGALHALGGRSACCSWTGQLSSPVVIYHSYPPFGLTPATRDCSRGHLLECYRFPSAPQLRTGAPMVDLAAAREVNDFLVGVEFYALLTHGREGHIEVPVRGTG
jgi:hypothetical protein